MDLIKELTKSQLKEMPAVEVGDTVKVHVKVKEGARERIQVFEGTVIAKKHGGCLLYTSLLVHLVDVSGSEGRDPIADFDAINQELRQYLSLIHI